MNFLRKPLAHLITQSERYLKTDMAYLTQGGFWLLLGQGVSSLSALVLAIAFGNLVPQETYGTYKYLLSIAAMLSVFSLPGMQTAVARAVARNNEGVMHAATTSRIMYGCIGALVGLSGSVYYFLNGNTELSIALLSIAAFLPFFDTFTSYLSYTVGKRRFDLQTKYHAVTQAVSVAILLVTLALTHNVLLILIAYFFPLSAMRFFFWKRLDTQVKRDHVDQHIQEETLSYGKHLTVMQILGIISDNLDKILVWKYLGPAQVAVYSFAVAIPEQLKGPLKGMGDLAFPKFAQKTHEHIARDLPALWPKLLLYAGVLVTISVIYIVVSPYIYHLLFPHYLESVPYSQVFSLSLVAGVSVIPLSILDSQRKLRAQYLITTLQPLLQIALFAGLLPLFGVWGIIFAFLISRCVIAVLVIVLVARIFSR